MTRRWAAQLALAAVTAVMVGCGGEASQSLPAGERHDGATYSLIVPAAGSWQASSGGEWDKWVSSLGTFQFRKYGSFESLDTVADDVAWKLKDYGMTNTAKQSVNLPTGEAIEVSGGTDKTRTIVYLIVKGGVAFELACEGLSDDLCAGIAQSVTLK